MPQYHNIDSIRVSTTVCTTANTTASMQLTHLTKLHIAPLVAHIEAHVGTSVAQLFAQDGANLCSEKGASFDVIQGILMMFNCHLWFHTG